MNVPGHAPPLHSAGRRPVRHGVALLYALFASIALIAFVSLAVDLARAQLAKSELQAACDAAARYGVTGLTTDIATVQARVVQAAAQSRVDGNPLVIDPNLDIEFGVWNPTTKSFAVLTGSSRISATAIRVTARRSASRNTGLPLLWGAILGRSTVDLRAVSTVARGSIVRTSIDADSCPWLAGMPNGSIVAMSDENTANSVAPAQSPVRVTGLAVTPGSRLSFRQVSGTTTWDDADGSFGPDGDTSWIVSQAPANGINTTHAPIQCLVGIFLDNRAPNTYSQAAVADFTTSTSRDFNTLSPALKQVFFIGDGMNSSQRLQQFVVPAGATRLYLGLMDEKGWWWDNYGTVSTSVMDDSIQYVK